MARGGRSCSWTLYRQLVCTTNTSCVASFAIHIHVSCLFCKHTNYSTLSYELTGALLQHIRIHINTNQQISPTNSRALTRALLPHRLMMCRLCTTTHMKQSNCPTTVPVPVWLMKRAPILNNINPKFYETIKLSHNRDCACISMVCYD